LGSDGAGINTPTGVTPLHSYYSLRYTFSGRLQRRKRTTSQALHQQSPALFSSR